MNTDKHGFFQDILSLFSKIIRVNPCLSVDNFSSVHFNSNSFCAVSRKWTQVCGVAVFVIVAQRNDQRFDFR